MMRRLLVLVSLLAGVQGCSRSGDSPRVAAGEAVVAGTGTPVDPPPSGSQTGYATAWDGTNYLVVWADVRGTTGSDVYAARVSPTGQLLDTTPIVVSAAAGDQLQPDVAFDGTNFLVVWQDQRLGGDKNIHCARVSRAGVVLDPASIPILQPGHQINPAVGFDGTNYLVIWEDQRTSSADVWGARVSPAGALLPAFPISTASGNQVQPAVGCSGATCLAAWRDGRNGGPDVYGARISPTAVLDPTGIGLSRASASQGAPAVGGDGTGRFFVAWSDTRSGSGDVYGTRVGVDGAVLDPAGIAIASAPGTQQAAAVAFEGAYFLVVWEDGRSGTGYDVYGARVSDATVLDPGGFLVEPGTSGSRVAIASDRVGRALVASDVRQIVDPTLGTSVSRLAARILVSRAALTVFRTGSGSGTVTSAPAGIDCGLACSAFFDAPTDVNLTPTPVDGSAFVGWTGACSGAGACTVTVNDTRTVTAKFSLLYPLTVTHGVGAAGSVVSNPAGIDCDATCTAQFPDETLVELTPVPGTNSLFGSWSGDCLPSVLIYDPVNPAPCSVPMTRASSVTATFRTAYKLTVNATGTASGTVDASPAYYPIHCTVGSTEGCSSKVLAMETVTLTATPAADAILKTWSGCTSFSGNQCTVSLTSARTVTATFQPAFYTLTTTVSGSGTIDGTGISCSTGSTGDCTEPVANGETTTLTATPAPDAIFKFWTGCNSVSGTTCTVSMTAAKTVTATFQPARYPLTLSSTGGGGGTVFAESGGFTCVAVSGVPCSTTVANGDTIVLTASPDTSSVFKSWAGCNGVSGSSCTVVMNASKSLTVRLEPSTYALSVALSGSGSVAGPGISCSTGSTDGCSAMEPNGDSVTLTATPGPDMILKTWTGCGSWSGTTCTVVMASAKGVTATFQPAFYTLTTTVSGSGTIDGSGISCTTGSTGDCTEPVANGATTTLTATPAPDAIFKFWTGCNTVSGTTCTVSMTAAKTVTATFQPAFYTLTTTISGSGTLDGPGISCTTGTTGDCTEPVANGATVTLTATPAPDAIFKSWLGCTTFAGNTCTVSMTGAKNVTATFQPAFYTLTTTVSGNGTIDGSGISCTTGSTGDCTEPVANGAAFVLTATPAPDAIFKSWTGCSIVAGNQCTVNMTGAKTVTATFQPAFYALTAAVSGDGTVDGPGISCTTGSTGDCSEPLANGATVTLNATPAANAIFKTWSGCNSVSGTTCTVAMTSAKSVTATFQPAFYTLTATVSGSGTIDGTGISCTTGSTGDCSEPVANGAVITLTATPAPDAVFKFWTGCNSVSGATCTVSMMAAKSVTATFQPAFYALTTTISGSGTVDGPGISCTTGTTGDCTEPEPNGAMITLTATPADGQTLRYWSGCNSVSGNTCTVTMTAAKTVTATFWPATYPLTVVVSGSGTVDGPGILCTTGSTGDCSEAVANGGTVTLNATPAEGAVFNGWVGCTSLSGTTCTVNMNGARTVTANF